MSPTAKDLQLVVGEPGPRVVVDVVEIWEDSMVFRVSPADTADVLRRVQLQVATKTRSTHFERYLDEKQCKEPVALTSLGQGSHVHLRLRGLFSNSKDRVTNWGSWTSVQTQLMRPLKVLQGAVHPDKLVVRWEVDLPDDLLPLSAPITNFELCVMHKSSVQSKVVFEKVLSSKQVEMEYIIPNLKPFHIYHVKMRSRRALGVHNMDRRDQLWSQWGEEQEFVTLPEVTTRVVEIGQDWITIEWARDLPPAMGPPHTSEGFSLSLARTKSYRVVLWAIGDFPSDVDLPLVEALERGQEAKARSSPVVLLRELTDDSEAGRPNTFIGYGLEPDTRYMLRVTVLNHHGDWMSPQHFQFTTPPPLTLLRIREVTHSSIEVAWVVDDKRIVPAEGKAVIDGAVVVGNELHSKAEEYHVRFTPQGGSPDTDGIIITSPASSPSHWVCATNLNEATPYTIQVRCRTVTGHVGNWSRSVTVTTLDRVGVKVARRGPTYLDVEWGRLRAGPVIVTGDSSEVASASDRYAGEDEQEGGKILSLRRPRFRYRAIVDPVVPSTAVKRVVVGVTVKEEEEILAPHLADEKGEGNEKWGRYAEFTHGMVREFELACGNTRFEGLVPDTLYRVSINEQSEGGGWGGRSSILVRTLEANVEILEEHAELEVAPHIDMSYGDSDASTTQATRPHSAPSRTDSSSGRSVTGLFQLQVEAQEVGETYVVVTWKAADIFSSSRVGRPSTAHGPRGSAVLSAGAFNKRTREHREYKIKLIKVVREAFALSPGESTTSPLGSELSETTAQSHAVQTTGSDAPGHVVKALYLRCKGSATRITGLESNQRYGISMAAYDTERMEWSPWSSVRYFSTMCHLQLFVQAVHRDAVSLRWSRLSNLRDDLTVPRQNGMEAGTVVKRYYLKIVNLATGKERQVSIDGRSRPLASTYTLSGIECNTVHRITVAPQYSNGSWGAASAPADLYFASLPFELESVGEEVATLRWEPHAPFTAVGEMKTIITLRELTPDGKGFSGWRSHTEVLDPTITQFRLQHLKPGVPYDVHVVVMGQVLVPNEATVGSLGLDPDKSGVIHRRHFTTFQQLRLDLLVVGEGFAVVQWLKRIATPDDCNNNNNNKPCPSRRSLSSPPPNGNLTGEDLLAMKISQHLEEAVCVRRVPVCYELNITDCTTRRTTTEQVSPAVLNPGVHVTKRIEGLQLGRRYRVRVRQRLQCGAWGSFSDPIFFTMKRPLACTILKKGEDFLEVVWSRAEAGKAVLQEGDSADDTVVQQPYTDEQYEVDVTSQHIAPSATATCTYPVSIAQANPPFPDFQEKQEAPHHLTLLTKEPRAIVQGLHPNTIYAIKVRQLSALDTWGSWSPEARGQTMPSLRAEVTARGVDYVELEWRRCSARIAMGRNLQAPTSSGTVLVEAEATDHQTGELVKRVRVECANDASDKVVFTPLDPERLYAIRLRLYYADGLWGHWSPVVVVDTLPPLGCALESVGDDFIKVFLQRPMTAFVAQDTEMLSDTETLRSPLVTTSHRRFSKCSTLVKSTKGHIEAGEKLGDTTVVSTSSGWVDLPPFAIVAWQVRVYFADDKEPDDAVAESEYLTLPPTQQHVTLSGLFSDTLYAIQCRCIDEHYRKSPWSEPINVSTLPLINVNISYVSENFFYVQWARKQFTYLTVPHLAAKEVQGDRGCDVRWDVVVYQVGPTTKVVQHHELPGDLNEMKVDGVLPNTKYGVTVRAGNIAPVVGATIPTDGESLSRVPYGVWSPKIYCRTLCRISPEVVRIGQDYALFAWRAPDILSLDPTNITAEPSESIPSPLRRGRNRRTRQSIANNPREEYKAAAVVRYDIVVNVYADEASVPDRTDTMPWDASGQYLYLLGGLKPNSFYEVKISPRYATGPRPGGGMREDGGSFTDPLCFQTLGVLHIKVTAIGEDTAVFSCAPPKGRAHPPAAVLGRLPPQWDDTTSVRDFEVAGNGVPIRRAVLQLDLNSPHIKADLVMSDLLMDHQYEIKTREKAPPGSWKAAHYGGWVDLYTFYTKPRPPVPGDLVEWRNGIIAFTFGIASQDPLADPKFGADIPSDYMFSVEMKVKSDAPRRKDEESEPWMQVAVVNEGRHRQAVDHHITQLFFRVRAANHFITDHDIRTPLWGDYSPVMHWKEPPRPQSAAALRVFNLKAHEATVVWDRPLNHTTQPDLHYHIFLAHSTDGGGRQWTHLAKAYTNTYHMVNLDANTCYRVSVRAESNFGKSKKTTVLTFTTNILDLRGKRTPARVPYHSAVMQQLKQEGSGVEEEDTAGQSPQDLPQRGPCSLYDRFMEKLNKRRKVEAAVLRKLQRRSMLSRETRRHRAPRSRSPAASRLTKSVDRSSSVTSTSDMPSSWQDASPRVGDISSRHVSLTAESPEAPIVAPPNDQQPSLTPHTQKSAESEAASPKKKTRVRKRPPWINTQYGAEASPKHESPSLPTLHEKRADEPPPHPTGRAVSAGIRRSGSASPQI